MSFTPDRYIVKEARTPVIMLVFGTGGHTEQADRLMKYVPDLEFACITASRSFRSNGNSVYVLPKLRGDYRRWYDGFFLLWSVSYQFVLTAMVLALHRPEGMVSTGSGVAIVPALIMRAIGRPVAFFESWSRIYTPSISGKIMYRISTLFFIQHQELQKAYPNARYCGRL
jgi:beta-1,4-N-acetylglucosaminyltransferase